MSAWSINNVIRTPLLLMAGVEPAILFSSVYVAAFIVFGNLADCERMLGPLAPKTVIVAVVILVSLIAMGLYQFHQRIYFREAAVRVMVGIAAGCLVLAAIFYALPMVMISHDIASIAVGYALVLLLLVRYYFVRTVDENVFRRRMMIYGAGERAAGILDLRRPADRRGFRIVGKFAAPGDSIIGGQKILTTNGKSITHFAVEIQADEIVAATCRFASSSMPACGVSMSSICWNSWNVKRARSG